MKTQQFHMLAISDHNIGIAISELARHKPELYMLAVPPDLFGRGLKVGKSYGFRSVIDPDLAANEWRLYGLLYDGRVVQFEAVEST